MIDSVQNIKAQGQNPFADYKTKGNYYLTLETAQDIFETQEKNKEKKHKRVGLIIASSAIAAALGIFALTKGLPKNTYRWLQNLSQRLEENVNRRKLNGESGPVTSFYNYSLKKVLSFADKAKSINNFSSFKDLFLARVMAKNKYSQSLWQKITDLFENLARNSVNKAYRSSDKQFGKLFENYAQINQKILKEYPDKPVTINNVTKTVSQWIEEIAARKAKITEGYKTGFGKTARNNRYEAMKEAVTGLQDKVWNTAFGKAQDIKNPKLYTTFIAEDFLAADKLKIAKNVNLLRHSITHDILDSYRASKQALDNISAFIDPRDKASNELLKQLRAHLVTYKKLSGPSEKVLREKVNSEIVETLKSLSARLQASSDLFKYDKATVKQAAEYISEFENILGKSSKGEFQEILTVYKALLPKEEYVKLRSNTNSAIKTFDKAINKENDLFFDKLRDLSLGSGPTDVLSVIGAVGGVGLGLTKADDKDERISATLKYGIPVVGAVATSLAMTVCLVAGFKSMAIGTISGMLMSDIGTRLDKLRVKNNKQKEDIKNAEAVKAEINAKSA